MVRWPPSCYFCTVLLFTVVPINLLVEKEGWWSIIELDGPSKRLSFQVPTRGNCTCTLLGSPFWTRRNISQRRTMQQIHLNLLLRKSET
ncbi:hypothetical protein M501DRAFT_218793 [Patellaria atrata CBS 101060]|uniref:Secreted protein n=1 Tax=Patellaria atrata CBS 101060 TaxID=1346257 RepID=A0A9P4S6X9_9PEZI|nr:hypothetical protein M501DRAFT_218793 [Patellaria atrata CBS 101060]